MCQALGWVLYIQCTLVRPHHSISVWVAVSPFEDIRCLSNIDEKIPTFQGCWGHSVIWQAKATGTALLLLSSSFTNISFIPLPMEEDPACVSVTMPSGILVHWWDGNPPTNFFLPCLFELCKVLRQRRTEQMCSLLLAEPVITGSVRALQVKLKQRRRKMN